MLDELHLEGSGQTTQKKGVMDIMLVTLSFVLCSSHGMRYSFTAMQQPLLHHLS
jgi:hypothetical protein